MKRDTLWKGPYRQGGPISLTWVSTDDRYTLSRPTVDWRVIEIATGRQCIGSYQACMDWIKGNRPGMAAS